MGVSAVNWDHDWVLDSGAPNHITGNRDLLTNISVTFANGTVCEARYMGDAVAHSYLLEPTRPSQASTVPTRTFRSTY